jgi:glycerol-3-phosphate acyltransferase PlsY
MALRNTVSLASVAVFGTLPVVALVLRQAPKLVLIYALLAALGIVRHAANIRRLRTGEEPKLDRSYFRRR